MCGRFTLQAKGEALAEVFDLAETPAFEPSANIAPTASVVTVLDSPEQGRVARAMRWGLLPRWAKSPREGAKMINARAETVHQKPSYSGAFRRRRCLVAADGWYEWRRGPGGKQPYRFVSDTTAIMGLGGLWSTWTSPEGGSMETCAIITVAPNRVAAKVHDRMPLILPAESWARWLDPSFGELEPLLALLKTPSDEGLRFFAVDRAVSSVRNQGAHLSQPVPEQGRLF